MSSKMPRPFVLYRREDATGVSGTGVVASGAQFPDGTVVLRWLGEFASTVVWGRIEHALAVHGHDGRTHIVWADEVVPEHPELQQPEMPVPEVQVPEPPALPEAPLPEPPAGGDMTGPASEVVKMALAHHTFPSRAADCWLCASIQAQLGLVLAALVAAERAPAVVDA